MFKPKSKNFGKINVSVIGLDEHNNEVIYICEFEHGNSSSYNGNLTKAQWDEINEWLNRKYVHVLIPGEEPHTFVSVSEVIQLLRHKGFKNIRLVPSEQPKTVISSDNNKNIEIFWGTNEKVALQPLEYQEFIRIKNALKWDEISEREDGFVLSVRCGDADRYNDFCDIHSAVDYLEENGVSHITQIVSPYAFEASNFKGHNHISILWTKDLESSKSQQKPLTEDEWDELRMRLEKLPITD